MRTVRILQCTIKENQMTLTSLHLFAILRHVVWSNGPQELNVVIAVVFCHLFTTGFVWSLETEGKIMREKVTAEALHFIRHHYS